VSLVRLKGANCILKGLIHGNEKVVFDLTFSNMVIANAVKFSCFCDDRRE
jgi:hypothetical protein